MQEVGPNFVCVVESKQPIVLGYRKVHLVSHPPYGGYGVKRVKIKALMSKEL